MHYLDEHQYIFSNQKNFKFIPRYAFLIAMKMKCNLSFIRPTIIYIYVHINKFRKSIFILDFPGERKFNSKKNLYFIYNIYTRLKIVNLKIPSRKGCDLLYARVYTISDKSTNWKRMDQRVCGATTSNRTRRNRVKFRVTFHPEEEEESINFVAQIFEP